ncbi:hypothetical protein [Actinoplanes sp. NPDC051851]|uniref:hypothetical protein n=1 Tax=Actinoplanes sp. NPDC051851 TaxID=3154753 RepID=UPI00343F4528
MSPYFVPALPRPFVGREELLNALMKTRATEFRQGRNSRFMLHGAPGIGSSSVAALHTDAAILVTAEEHPGRVTAFAGDASTCRVSGPQGAITLRYAASPCPDPVGLASVVPLVAAYGKELPNRIVVDLGHGRYPVEVSRRAR